MEQMEESELRGFAHLSERGDLVRRRSEVVIANRLHVHGIDYVYEQPFSTNQGHTLYPDFTITDDSRGITFYWEHLMALDDPRYRELCQRNHAKYLVAGIVPWQLGGGPNGTLIETSDGAADVIDPAKVDRLIEGVIVGYPSR
jgi:hypothetical protein